MPALQKAQVRTLINALLSDESRELWSDSVLDLLISTTYDDLWAQMLTMNPYFNRQVDAVGTLLGAGYVDVRLVADGGSLTQRFYRLQTIFRTDRFYRAIDPRDTVVQNSPVVTTIYAPDNRYVFYADQIWLFPLTTTTPVEVSYSFLPPLYTSLMETDAISWPTGMESALIYAAAQRAESKNENLQQAYAGMAKAAWDTLLTQVRNRTHFMLVPWDNMSAAEWGGV